MCGSTSQQDEMYASQSAFFKEMSDHYSVVFGKQQNILDQLTTAMEPFLKAGPSQTGFSTEERTALDTQATDAVAANYAKAKEALGDTIGARGGDEFIPSGGDLQLQGELAASGAQEKSDLENKIITDDYKAGHENWEAAVNTLGGVASQQNANDTSRATTGAGSAAADTANEIAAASNSVWSAAIGAVGGVAGQAAGNWAKKPCWIAAVLYGGWEEPRTVLVREWMISEFTRTWYGRLTLRIYCAIGERTAIAISRYPILKQIFKPLFDAALRKAQAHKGEN